MSNIRKKIFLDHNGTLTYINILDFREAYKKGVEEFLSFLVQNFNVNWCTSWDYESLIKNLKALNLSDELLSKINYFNYDGSYCKSENIIKETRDFILIDDDPLQCELDVLEKEKLKDNLIKANDMDEEDLYRIMELLRKYK